VNTVHTGWGKNSTIFVRLTTSLNINRFLKFFYCQNQETICNKAITIEFTTTKVCHYTTLWNVSVLRITIKNKTIFVATHFKKSTTETTCLLSQLLSKKSHLTVFTPKCLRLAAGRRIQPATPLTNGAINQCWSRNWSLASPAWVRHLTFYEVVQRHTWRVVGSTMAVSLQIVFWFWQ